MDRATFFRAPSAPIVSCDPFFSIWSGADAPTCADTEIWYGDKQPISIQIELDGVRYRLMGAKAEPAKRGDRVADVPALKCVGCEVRALTTSYWFTDGRAFVEMSFMTPKMTDDLDVFSRPVTYATVRTSGARKVKVFASISPALATNDDSAEMVVKKARIAGLQAYSIGRKEQRPL